ncbi:hypothetical protein ACFWOL_15350 [Streptomyces sp. NPDC058442]|uniref:hypothetical protein n=1 Tax=Streptomyces sp. NPDC058442 TaxID=3346503 RepID=UPI003658C8F5
MTTTMRTLPHDPYIEAICEALDKAGPEVKDGRTDDCETRGTYCYLNAVIELDMLSVGLQDERNNLLLIWEWHTGIEAPWESERGPVWQFAELKDDGSNEYPTDLPVLGYASPDAIVEAVRKVITGEIRPGSYINGGQWQGWDGGIIGDTWERHAKLDAACEAWGTEETAE